MYFALHLDVHTCVEWPWTLKPLKISSPGVIPPCSPSLECIMYYNNVATIQLWNCSSGHSCSRWPDKKTNRYYVCICIGYRVGFHFHIDLCTHLSVQLNWKVLVWFQCRLHQQGWWIHYGSLCLVIVVEPWHLLRHAKCTLCPHLPMDHMCLHHTTLPACYTGLT